MLKTTARIVCDGCFNEYEKRRTFFVCETEYEIEVLIAFAQREGWKITKDVNEHDYEVLCPSCLRLMVVAQEDGE